MDTVLVIEAQTKEFAQRFWEFVQKESIEIVPEAMQVRSFTDLISLKKLDILQ